MADQCIVCLEILAAVPTLGVLLPPAATNKSDSAEPAKAVADGAPTGTGPSTTTTPDKKQNKKTDKNDGEPLVACIEECGHMLHDDCLQGWCKMANSCPLCRSIFHKVLVYDSVGGKFPPISWPPSYKHKRAIS